MYVYMSLVSKKVLHARLQVNKTVEHNTLVNERLQVLFYQHSEFHVVTRQSSVKKYKLQYRGIK